MRLTTWLENTFLINQNKRVIDKPLHAVEKKKKNNLRVEWEMKGEGYIQWNKEGDGGRH